MSGMGSTLQLNNPTVVAAFQSALIHQGIIALLIFFLLAMLWVSVREWAARLLGAWSERDCTSWTLSLPYPLGAARPLSASFGSGSLGVVLSGGRALPVSGPGAAWRSLPALPATASSVPDGGATLAAVPGGGFEVLSARGGRLSVWALWSGGSGWSQFQAIRVAIPYG